MKLSTSKKAKPQADRKLPVKMNLKDLVAYPFPCPNCDQLISTPKLFCSELCKQVAKFIRYVRACRQDGRDQQPDVQEAIQIKLAMILGEGYPEQERRLPEPIRNAVIQRDGGRCKKCGKPGNQIDHIQGSSSEMQNLKLLCRACHNKKTTAAFIPITPESSPEVLKKEEVLDRRIGSPAPLRLCDAEEWDLIDGKILSQRRQVIKAQGEAGQVDGSVRRNPVLDYAETAGFYDPEETGEMSDGEQAEYFALLDGGGDEVWAAEMFGLDLQSRQKENRPKSTRKSSAVSKRAQKGKQGSSSSKKKRN